MMHNVNVYHIYVISIYLSIYPPIYLSTHLSIYLPTYLSIYPPIYLSIYQHLIDRINSAWKTKTTRMNGRCSSGMGNESIFSLNFFITQVNYNDNTNYLTWRQIPSPWVAFRSWFLGCRGLCGGNLVEWVTCNSQIIVVESGVILALAEGTELLELWIGWFTITQRERVKIALYFHAT